MRPFVPSILVAVLGMMPATSQAGFIISLKLPGASTELLPQTDNQAVDIFLKFDPSSLGPDYADYKAQIRFVTIGAFIGDSEHVKDTFGTPSGTGNEGHFSRNAGFEDGISMQASGSIWQPDDSMIVSSNIWGYNVAQAQFTTPQPTRRQPDAVYRELPQEGAKIGTFHVSTRNMSQSTLKISLSDPHGDLLYQNSSPLTTTVSAQNPLDPSTVIDYAISDPSQLTIEGSTTFDIAHTPEPATIGFAGLGMTAAWGWLRTRRRRRKAAR